MVGENADHIIAGDGSVDAAHSKSFVYIGHTYLHSRSEELLQVQRPAMSIFSIYDSVISKFLSFNPE